jgi:hypothetical protein
MLSVPAGAIKVPPPENVDLDQVAKTHPLLTDFPPLPSDELIRTAIKKQSGGPGGSPPPPVNAGTPSAVAPTGPASSTRTTILPPAPKRTRPPRTSTNNPPSTPTPTPKTGPTRPPKGGGTKVTPTPTPQRTLLRPTGNALGPGAGSNQPKKTIRPPPPTPTPPVIR